MSEPELLLVDELSLGLMPKMIDICYDAIAELRRGGLTIVLVEQSTQLALHVADHVCVLESGRPVWRGSAVEARNSSGLIDALLGLGRETENDAPPS
jgi:branched-chain amino acid transport system ATP-binding protein